MKDDFKINLDLSELKSIVKNLGLSPNDYFIEKSLINYTDEVDIEAIKAEQKLNEKLIKGDERSYEDVKKDVVGDLFLTNKGKPVLVYIKDTRKNIVDIRKYPHDGSVKFHTVWCNILKNMNRQNCFNTRYVDTIRDDGIFDVDAHNEKGTYGNHQAPLLVCQKCLEKYEDENFLKCYSKEQIKCYSKEQKREVIRKQKRKVVEEFNIKKFLDEAEGIVRYLLLPERRDTTTPVSRYTSHYTFISSLLKKENNYTCKKCKVLLRSIGLRKYLHAHHINGLRYENDRNNLQILCASCHFKEYHPKLVSKHQIAIYECDKIRREQGII